jgi:hypothetical protein
VKAGVAENCHAILFVEHDPSLYEDAQEMTEVVSKALREAPKEAAALVYLRQASGSPLKSWLGLLRTLRY